MDLDLDRFRPPNMRLDDLTITELRNRGWEIQMSEWIGSPCDLHIDYYQSLTEDMATVTIKLDPERSNSHWNSWWRILGSDGQELCLLSFSKGKTQVISFFSSRVELFYEGFDREVELSHPDGFDHLERYLRDLEEECSNL